MKKLFIGILLLVQTCFAIEECPSNQTCYNYPTASGFHILSISANELHYASYGKPIPPNPEGPSCPYPNNPFKPEKAQKVRANRACRFFGHRKSTFATSKMTWDTLVEIYKDGSTKIFDPFYASYSSYYGDLPHATFEYLNCE